MFTIAQNLYDYRELMTTLAMKNIALRYKQVYLGIAWAILKPLMLIFTPGKVECEGKPGTVFKQFLDATTLMPEHGKESAGLNPSVNTGDIEVQSIEVVTDEHADGTPLCRLFSDLHIRLRFVVQQPLSKLEINLGLHNPEMVFMTKSSNLFAGQNFDLEAVTHTLDVKIERLTLSSGTYGIGIGILLPLLPQSTLTYLPTRWNIVNS